MRSFLFILSIAVMGCVYADIDNSILSNFPGLTNNLPLSGLNGLNADMAKEYFQQKCKNQTNDDKIFDKALEGKDKLKECIKNNFNISNIHDEIEKAKPTGDLDLVFGKYCRKIPTVTTCVKDFSKIIEPCLTETENDGMKLFFNITQSIVDFLCYKDGDRIALFIAEGGIQCFQDKQNEIIDCGKQNVNTTANNDSYSKEMQCNMLSNTQSCVVSALEKCSEPTPANLVDALFKYVRKLASCPKKN